MGEYEILEPQELMIKLLARIAYPPEKVREIVAGGKQKVVPWLKAYNLCDGKHDKQKDMAKEAGVDGGAFSRALQEWEKLGIIFQVKNNDGKVCYKAITYLEEKED
ncbi:hypothetical protein CEE36_08235 [candidate division TA06 bacterium B3_TA06]|uniref:Uncharacterized protein n=1 Tax=candidate division TA06 bacterium B3_TA06 TaxID=2012487 RepID=A0A532V2I3_UNCT6|nr:MAG: hypothetical protein CEE36_08235 [candidate division TA06 bacterium B3_TA06]